MRVLDVGCGTGRLAPIVLSLGGVYHGIDQSAPMISAARMLHPGLHFSQCDALRDPLDEYDVIMLMHNTLGTFFPYRRRISLISILRDRLCNNGRLIFSCHDVNGPFSLASTSFLDWPFRIIRRITGSGYAVQRYHGELILIFRATPHFIARELSVFDFTITGEWPDNSRDKVDWTYYLAHLQ
jgi:SAM-dependent methyltransferase